MAVNQKIFAIVGNFGFHPGPKGLDVYAYDPATAAMEHVAAGFAEVNVGHQSIDAARKMVYLTNECPSQRGQTGGGGYLLAVKVGPESGKLNLVSEKPSLSAEPCFTCLDKSRHFILVSHHVDFGFVTKIVKHEQGYAATTVFDDTALVLFRINPDGSLGEACDLALTPGEGSSGPHTISRHHSVQADPSGELFVVCDKGLDRFHTYRLDREHGKLVRLQDTAVETGLVPRYGVFHPSLRIFYANFERKTVVHAYRYDVATGSLDPVCSVPLLPGETAFDGQKKVESADILIHPNGRYLYVSIRGANTIALLDVDDGGSISLRESVDCGGVNPRGLAISPDGRFLFAGNIDSGNIATFAIGADGSLVATGSGVQGGCPGSIRFLAV